MTKGYFVAGLALPPLAFALALQEECSILQSINPKVVLAEEEKDGSECRCPGYFREQCEAEAAQGCVWSDEGESHAGWCQCVEPPMQDSVSPQAQSVSQPVHAVVPVVSQPAPAVVPVVNLEPPFHRLSSEGFEYVNSLRCANEPGSLRFTSTTYDHCQGFDTRTSISGTGIGPRGIIFQGDGYGHMNIGLQQAGWNGADAVSSQPDTWDSSSNANFKEIYDAIITTPERCTSAAHHGNCAYWMDTNGFDAGFSIRGESAYAMYNGHLSGVGRFSEDNTYALVVDGNDFKWYVNDDLVKTESGVQGVRASEIIQGPLWAVASLFADGVHLSDFKFITA